MQLFFAAVGWAMMLWVASLFISLPGWLWFVLWLGLLVLMAFGQAQEEQEKIDAKSLKKCKACAEDIKLDAIKCKHCGEMQA